MSETNKWVESTREEFDVLLQETAKALADKERDAFNTGMESAEAKLKPRIAQLEQNLAAVVAERDELLESCEVKDGRFKSLLQSLEITSKDLAQAKLDLEIQYSTAQRYKAALQAIINEPKHWQQIGNILAKAMVEIAEEALKEPTKGES